MAELRLEAEPPGGPSRRRRDGGEHDRRSAFQYLLWSDRAVAYRGPLSDLWNSHWGNAAAVAMDPSVFAESGKCFRNLLMRLGEQPEIRRWCLSW